MMPMQLVNILRTDILLHTNEPKLYTRTFTENLVEFL